MKGFAGRLWAIATVTLLEASRRKVFLILLLFAAAVMSSAAFFPSIDPESRLRLAEVWALRASALFTAIAALFLAAFSLPSDFEQKRIYLLASKPVSKATVFLGKFLGFVLMLVIFVGGMGLITVGFLRTVQLFGGKDFPPLVAYPQVHAAAFGGQGSRPSVSIENGSVIRGGHLNSLLRWDFEGLDPSRFPEPARLTARFGIGAIGDQYRASGNVLFRIGNPGEPAPQLDKIFMNTNRDTEVKFPRRLIGDDGRLTILVRCGDSDGILAGGDDSVLLYQGSDSFEFNFFRGMTLIFLQSLLVLALTMTASTVMSAPLSILMGIMLYIAGNSYTFVQDGIRDIDRGLHRFDTKKSERTPENLHPWILRVSSFLSRSVLTVVPNFDHFDFSRWLLRDLAVSWSDLAEAGGKSIPHVLVVCAVGMIIMIFKTFG